MGGQAKAMVEDKVDEAVVVDVVAAVAMVAGGMLKTTMEQILSHFPAQANLHHIHKVSGMVLYPFLPARSKRTATDFPKHSLYKRRL